MEYVEILRIMPRMCETLECEDCPLSQSNNLRNITCLNFMKDYPAESERVIINWDIANPIITMIMDFLDKYPNALLDNGIPRSICPDHLGYKSNDKCSYPPEDKDCCVTCWNRVINTHHYD